MKIINICLANIIMPAILIFNAGTNISAQSATDKPVADVMSVMKLASDSKIYKLWPGFAVDEIPVMVYDSLNTYLFNSTKAPEGFKMSDIDQGVYVFEGQHPLVRGNSIVMMEDHWTATSVLSSSSRRTGERYDLKDMAGIIVHEQFHIFQRVNHPNWRQNDGLLLIYPEETVESLLLRRMEKEAFKRAVVSETDEQIAGWLKLGMQKRRERLDPLPSEFYNYENELQLTEGLSDYIEKRARGQHPLVSINITNDIAPAGIRDLGYVEGRWMAMILDRLSADWKLHLEKNDSLYLEDILNKLVAESSGNSKVFDPLEISRMRNEAEKDFNDWHREKKSEIEGFINMTGYSVEILASENPLVIRLFEPLEIEILDDGGVYHRLIFMAGNDNASLRIRNHPCITWFNNDYRLTRLKVNGLLNEPRIIESENKLVISENGISIQLNYSGLSIDNKRIIVNL